jgi:perosamine synthetase
VSLIPVAAPVIGEREIAYVTDAVRSGWVSSLGPYVERFESAFATFVGCRHAVAVSNGTVGLHLALHALGVGPGDEVVVPDLTFVATAHAVLQTGAEPVFVDVLPDTWCLDPEAVERAITSRTKAIVPVHLYGHPADMQAINAIAARHALAVVEDAAEAHGAEIDGRRVGSFGTTGVFSFYGNKLITTGEGGMVTTDDDALAHRLRYLKDHGMSASNRYYHDELAFNYRMTNLQAALGVAQLEQVDAFIDKKREIRRWYCEALGEGDDLQVSSESAGCKSVYWLFSVVLQERLPISRQEFGRRLVEKEVDWRPFFVPLNRLPHLLRFRTAGRDDQACPTADRLGDRGLNLPSGCTLDQPTVRRVAAVVNDLVTQARSGRGAAS